ncbi:MAG: hypothetical protein AAGL24_03560 [Pseudomonadota bacterium]
MGNRVHVPFDVFAMQVDVPVSTLVRDGALGWTCGQFQLDREGTVVFSGDLIAQSGFVCDMIETVLRRAEFEAVSIARLHVYFVETRPGEGDAILDLFRTRFPHGPALVLIPVPHFYYEGMLIEVDVFAGTGAVARQVRPASPVALEITEADGLVFVSALSDTGPTRSVAECLASIETGLHAEDLSSDYLISDHWFLSGPSDPSARAVLPASGYVTSSDALVRVGAAGPARLAGSLVFSSRSPAARIDAGTGNPVQVTGRRTDRLVWISGTDRDAAGDLVGQTRAIMAGIADALAAQDMSFDNVAKLTAHYVGGATPQELHANMKIRHGYYSRPGPASTGLPVSALNHPDCRIAIDVVAVT